MDELNIDTLLEETSEGSDTALTPEQVLANQASPMFASVNWNPAEDTMKDAEVLYEETLALPVAIRYGLANSKTQEAVMLLAQSYRINDVNKVGEISRIIRDIFIKGIREQIIVQRAQEKLGLTGESLNHFLMDFKRVVTFVKKMGEDEAVKNVEYMDIMSALKAYPLLGEQQVTDGEVILTAFEEPAEPSIKNWLEDYFSRIGTDKHNPLQRTDYLFNSENGKSLSSRDRDRLAVILKSYDTGEPIVIQKEDQVILFNAGSMESSEKKGVSAPIDPAPPTTPVASTTPEPSNVRAKEEDIKYFAPKASSNPYANAIPSVNKPAVQKNASLSPATPNPFMPPRPPQPTQVKPIPVVKVEERKTDSKAGGKNVVDLSEYM